MSFFQKIFGSKNDRYLKKLRPLVQKINALEPEVEKLADEEFPQRMAEYRQAVQEGSKTLDGILPEVFALVREAAKRTLGMRHFDVQLIGGIVLHKGRIAEMKTGEGKTLVATLAVSLNALSGKGVHVVTVNDYLAQRDAAWMGKVYSFRLDGKGLFLPWSHNRRYCARSRRQPAQGSLCRGHHLRHQQRVWLRLPARQHEILRHGSCAARPQFCHRGRSGLHPHR